MKDRLGSPLEARFDEIIKAANAAASLPRKEAAFPEDLAYLADCSEAMLDNFILQKMDSAAQHSRAIQAEQRAMVDDLAKAESARLIKLLLDDREMLDLLLSRRRIRNRGKGEIE